MNGMMDFALNLLSRNPNIANNPNAQNYISVIRSGDAAKGAEIANNICASYGISKEEALQQARGFFHI